MKRALIVLSGGQDSTTCLFLARAHGYELYALTVDYGQRHKCELDAAVKVAQMAGVVRHEIVSVGEGVLQSTSPLVSNNNLEQYDDMFNLPGGIEKTFVPMRNQLFLTIAFNRAVAWRCDTIFTGISQEDFGGYPDCRSNFLQMLEEASNEGITGVAARINFAAPLMTLTKKETVELSRRLPGCWEALAYTHTSYDGAYPPVGRDHATLLRAKGFLEAAQPDPLVLRAYSEGLMDLPETTNYDAFRSSRGLPKVER